MPITVRHDPSAGAVAGLAALSGLTQQQNIEAAREQQSFAQRQQLEARDRQLTQRLRQVREAQQEQIRAVGDRQNQAADDAMAKTAMQYGLDKQIQEDEFEREMAKKQEEARVQASQFEWEFSFKDRQKIAKLNEADQLVESDPAYADIRDQWKMMSLRARAGITGSAVPAPKNKPIYPEGQGIGASWKDEWGNVKTRKPTGEEVTQVPFKDTEEGLKIKYEAEQQKAALAFQAREAIARRAYAIKLEERTVPKLSKPKAGLFTDDPGGEDIGQDRFLSESEKEALLEKHFPSEQPTEAAAGPQPGGPSALDEVTREWDLELTEADRDLPERVAKAQAFLRRAKRDDYFNRKMSSLMETAIQEALQIGAEYNASR